jgi:lipopolysaccharide exporter
MALQAASDGTRSSVACEATAELAEAAPLEDDDHRQLDQRILRGSTWVAIGYGGRQIISIITMLALVRLVGPSSFGVVALAWTILFVVQTVQGSGLSTALVHRRHDVEEAAASVLVFSAASSIALYCVAFAAAPIAGSLFHAPKLVPVLRVLALTMPIGALATVPGAIFERDVNFRARTRSDLAAAMAQAATSIGLAVAGAGVWALIGGQLAASVTATTALWILIPWRPNPRGASWKMTRDLFRYGRFVTGSNLLLIACNSIDNVFVGRILGSTLLGFYSVAFRVTELPVLVIGSIVGRVMFPIYAIMQHDLRTIRRVYVQNLQRMALFSLPVSAAMFAAAEPFVRVVLGEQWVRSAPALRVLAIYAMVRAMIGPAGELFKGIGKPQYNLITTSTFLLTAAPALLLFIRLHGILGAAAAILTAGGAAGVVVMILTRRLVGLSPIAVIMAVGPSLVCSALSAGAIALIVAATGSLPPLASFASAIGAGGIVYVLSTFLLAGHIVRPLWVAFRASRAPDAVQAA